MHGHPVGTQTSSLLNEMSFLEEDVLKLTTKTDAWLSGEFP